MVHVRTYRRSGPPARALLLAATLALGAVATVPSTGAAQAADPPAAAADAYAPEGGEMGPDGAFHVRVTGEGRPLILIPGLASAGEVWSDVVERYADRHEVHVLTLAGFAGVPPLDTPDFLSTQRDAILRYIREEGLEAPVVVGHSLGGFLAFWIAATEPDAVGGVVAVDGVPFLTALGDTAATESTMATQAEQTAAFYATMTGQQMEAQTRMAAQAMVTAPAAVERIASWGAASDPVTAGRAYAEMMTTDLRDDVTAIEAPTVLVLAGAGRGADALERARRAYAHQISGIPHAELAVAPEARHFVMYDDPDFLFDVLDGLLEEVR